MAGRLILAQTILVRIQASQPKLLLFSVGATGSTLVSGAGDEGSNPSWRTKN